MEKTIEIISVMVASGVFIIIFAIVVEYFNYCTFIKIQKIKNDIDKKGKQIEKIN